MQWGVRLVTHLKHLIRMRDLGFVPQGRKNLSKTFFRPFLGQ